MSVDVTPRCDTCTHWCSFSQDYDDPQEPDDFGFCYVDVKPGVGPEPQSGDFHCEKWKLHPTLQKLSNQ
jgi:hypothetical protein